MKRTVLIIEDNLNQLEMLKKLVLEVDPSALVYTASASGPAYEILMERTIDVFLVDIILDTGKPGNASGMRLVEKIRKLEKYMFTPVVFITSLEDVTKYAYTDLNCLGYIEKPFDPEHVKRYVKKALNYSTVREKESTLFFRKDGIIYPIRVRDIIYTESLNHKMDVHLRDEPVFTVAYKTCKDLLEEADADCLLQCSRSTIINKDYVENVDPVSRYITMKTGEKVEIGITYKKRVLREFGDGR